MFPGTVTEFIEVVQKNARRHITRRLDTLTRSGLLRLAMQHEESRERHEERPLRAAADALFERTVLWTALAGAWLRQPEQINCVGVDSKAADVAIGSFLAMFDLSITYLWKDDIRLAAMSDRNTLPRHTVADLHLPHPVMWWSWASGLKVGTLSADGRMDEYVDREGLGSLVFRTVDDAITTIEVAKSANGQEPWFHLAFYTMNGAERYPDDLDSGTARYKHETMAKLLAFLASPFVETTVDRLPRHIRRWREVVAAAVLDQVQIVNLRRGTLEHLSRRDGETQREWQVRWMVSGHYRNQWYPSTETHKLIWIAPYMKGPDDKPMLPKVYQVVR